MSESKPPYLGARKRKPPITFPRGSPEDVAGRKAKLWRAAVSAADFMEAESHWSLQKPSQMEGAPPRDDSDYLALMGWRAQRCLSVVAYARPFLYSENQQGTKDQLSIELLGPPEEEAWWRGLHGELLSLRHKFIAHADSGADARDPVVETRHDPDGSLVIHMRMRFYWHLIDKLDDRRVPILMRTMSDRASAVAYDLAADLLAEGHIQPGVFPTDDAAGDEETLIMRLRRGPR